MKPQVPFGFAQGRLSTPLRFAQDDRFVVSHPLGLDQNFIENASSKYCNKSMDTILRKYTSFDEMKADEYRYWQSRPVHERLDAVEEMIRAAYAMKGWVIEPDVPRLQRPFVRIPRPWR